MRVRKVCELKVCEVVQGVIGEDYKLTDTQVVPITDEEPSSALRSDRTGHGRSLRTAFWAGIGPSTCEETLAWLDVMRPQARPSMALV
ncbi:hypothetical protein [Streptomyces echinatus]|uniref:hypothetical protein n=1 Tax=Streptomyces echinatus TaxID=67293 RepID=UPI0037A7A55A